jgi:hypothetical protein
LFVESSHHEIQLEHKIVPRQLNQINQNIPTGNPLNVETMKPSEHKHSETNHSAIGL